MNTGVTVSDAMTRKPIVVAPTATVSECARLMSEHKVGSLVIIQDDRLVGIVTETDMVRRCLAQGKDAKKTMAQDLSSEHVVTINPDVDVFEALRKMQDYDIRHLPVTDDGKLVGFLTVKDILRLQPQLFELLADKLEVREGERKLQRDIEESMEE